MAKKAAESGGATRAKAATKGEIYNHLATKTGLSKKQVASVFEGLTEMIKKELGKKGPALFQIPGLLKLKVVRKPATKAKPGINPFTKEPMMIKAKPARNVVKALPLKALKDSV
jgi:nucleoid DNA-binding protein